jgi:hypothetical protein
MTLMTSTHDVIAAFADGEPVDPGELTRALSEAEGREHLIDLLALRGLVGGPHATRPALVAPPVRPAASRLRWLSAAAALAGVCVLGGYLAGQRTAGTPPPAPAATNAAVVPAAIPVSAPAPTRVIRLEKGVDWNERGGGH